jgi:TATA-binding protein-associated factor Taf7
MSEQRFDRIENTLETLTTKMDKLSESMSSVIRMEEKQLAAQDRLDNIDNRLNTHGVTLDNHSIKIATISKASGANEWFVRILLVAIVSSIAIILRS